jgi:outer membrane protein TolC
MKKIKIYIVVAALFFGNIAVFAQDTITELNTYLEQAAKNNPKVQAAFNQYLAALEKVPQVGALPDPQFSFGYFIKPMQLLDGNQVADLQLMQMFPWFGTLKSAKDEASMMANAKYEAFNVIKAELFYQVKSNWYQLQKYDKEIALVSDNIELLESLEKLALIKFQSPGVDASYSSSSNSMNNNSGNSMSNSISGINGMQSPQSGNLAMSIVPSAGMQDGMSNKQGSLQDVLRVRMEILDQQNRLALLVDQKKTEETRFNALLNRDLKAPVLLSDSLFIEQLPAEELAIADSILSNNPMLAMLASETESYAIMEQKAKKMGLPMLGLGLNYMPIQQREGNTSPMNGQDMFMPMLSVSIPIYRKKFNAMQSEARLMQEAGKQQTIDLKNNLLVQYRQFVQNLDDAERRIVLYKEQEDLARKTTELLLSGFATTGSDYEEVLRMQLKVLDYGFNHIEAIVDYNTNVAMAEMLMNSINY